MKQFWPSAVQRLGVFAQGGTPGACVPKAGLTTVLDAASAALGRVVTPIRSWPAPLLLAVLPVALVLVDSNWLYPRPDTVDPWMYISYFLDPGLQMERFPGVYHGARLPIILPGFLLFDVLSPQTAIVVLHFLLFYLAIVSLYVTVATLFERRTALLTATLCGTYAMFMSSMGQTHADAFGIGYALLTLAFLARALKGHGWRLPMFLAGASSALFVHSNLCYVPLSVIFPWLTHSVKREVEKKPLTAGWASAVGGFVAMTAVLCLANQWLAGEPWFFAAGLRHASVTWHVRNVCADYGRQWVQHAWWLVAPLLTAVAGIVALWKTRADRSDSGNAIRAVVIGFGLVFGFMVLSEAIHAVHYLQFSFYASLLMPGMFLAIGGVASRFVPRWSDRAYRRAIAVVIASGLLSVAAVDHAGWAAGAIGMTIGAAIVMGLLMVLSSRPEGSADLVPALAMACLGLANLLVGVNYEQFLAAWPLERRHVACVEFIGKWPDREMGPNDGVTRLTRASVLGLTTEVFEILKPIDREKSCRFWYSVDEPLGSVFTAIASTFMWDRRFVTPTFPSLEAFGHRTSLQGVKRVVMLSDSGRDVIAAAQPTFAEEGVQGSLRLERDFFETHGIPLKITVLDLQ